MRFHSGLPQARVHCLISYAGCNKRPCKPLREMLMVIAIRWRLHYISVTPFEDHRGGFCRLRLSKCRPLIGVQNHVHFCVA
jgi:hypothetical protein